MTLLALMLAACRSSAPPAPPPPVEPQPAPVEIVAVDPDQIEQIAVGESTTCVIRGDGTTECRGKLPLPRTALRGTPDVSDHEVCSRGEGQVRCIRPGLDQIHPTAFVEITHGAGAPCGRDADGGVYCFYGEDEDGATLRPVVLPSPAVRVLADGFREYALLEDGQLVTWDPYEAMFRSPKLVVVDTGVEEVDGTYLWTCWRTDDGVRCRAAGKARRIKGLDHPDHLTVGRKHACALQDGVPWCWGDSRFGQLGPRKSSIGTAVKVPDVTDAVSIDAGYDHTCVLRATSELFCWGKNDVGQVAGNFP